MSESMQARCDRAEITRVVVRESWNPDTIEPSFEYRRESEPPRWENENERVGPGETLRVAGYLRDIVGVGVVVRAFLRSQDGIEPIGT